MKTIIGFGDSITHGGHDTNRGGWADMLKQEAYGFNYKLPNSKMVTVYNLGIPGEATDTAVKRFRPEVDMRCNVAGLGSGGDVCIVIGFGANDAAFEVERNGFRLPIDVYEKNMETLIREAKEFSKFIAVMTIPPVVEEITKEPNRFGKIRRNEYVDRYNERVRRVIASAGVDCIDVHAAFVQSPPRQLFAKDGLHLSTEGHALIALLMRKRFQTWDFWPE